jgi:hypothetical protein
MNYRVSISDVIVVHQVPRMESLLFPSLFYQPDEIALMRDEALLEQKFGVLGLADDDDDEEIAPTVKRDAVKRERRPAAPRSRSESTLNTGNSRRARSSRESKPEGGGRGMSSQPKKSASTFM